MEKLLKFLNAERGRRVALAQKIGRTPSAVSQWSQVPVEHVRDISDLTGISQHELRPDIFGEAA